MPDGGSGSSAKPGIGAAKRELFGYLLQERGVLRGPREILSAPNHHEHALSFAQEQLWFLDQLDPNGPAYNIYRAYNLVGSLNVECLQRAFDEIIRRHAILRSSFKPISEEPCEQTAPELSLKLSVQDLRDAPLAERDELVIQLIQEAARAPFSLQACPLLRVVLLRLDEELWALCVVTHQIVCDGSSFGLLNRELETFYRSAVLGEVPAVPELAIQYSDYVRWQRDWLNGEAFDRQLSFWQSQHTPLADPIHLPIDYGRPAVQSYQGSRRRFVIFAELTAALKAFCGENNASLFETMLSTFVVLLGAYSQQQDIVLGCPVSNRYAETPNLIGLFVNTLLLRVDLRGAPSFRDLVARVRGTCRSAFAHRDLPFQKLVEAMSSARDLSRNPLFNVMFALQGESDHELHLHGLKVEPIEIDNGTAKFDLMLSLEERGQELVGFIEYSTALFESATIERLAGHFLRVLEGLVAAPDRTVSALPLLREDERRQLVYEWNDTAADYPKEKCIHQLFEEQTERSPDAIAVAFADRQLTYRELNRRANQLGHYLIDRVGPEKKLVGISLERSIEMVVGLLGILKAGCAYVPLDPAYPTERLEFMLKDAHCCILLTTSDLKSVFGPRADLKMICLDSEWGTIAKQSSGNVENASNAANLAYVIYTSGSTGQPKGVQITHRSVINCLCSVGDKIGLTAKDIWFAVTTISFDIAGLELYLPLIRGGKVVLASHEQALDGAELCKGLHISSATVMQATPTTWNLLLDAGWKVSPGFKILCGGETLSRRLADRLLQSGASVWNMYGPTETTIWSTIYRVEPSERPVYIGRPLANTLIYILDVYMQPVPIGVHGDLYIGGDGVARGYLNRPELTAERFIRNPFSDDPQSRLYKTGDRARYRSDGNIEFLGRSDHQVKIRGHRIELGEIEAALNRHPAVKECVAVSFDQTGSESDNRKSKIDNPKSLAAYFISGDPKPTVAELRQFLGAKLPGAMIPSVFVLLDALPQTPNGKVDRNALPLPDGSRPELAKVFVEPRSELEELVAQVWREVLKRDQVGVHHNFFELGGHSLLATRVVARLRGYFNIDLPLRKLFELPSVARLAGHIETLRRDERGVRVPAIVPVPRNRPIPLSFSQRRLWFLEKLDPGLTGYNMPSTFEIEGALNISVLERALNEIINRHESLRTRIAEVDGRPYQEILSGLYFALPLVDLAHLSPALASAEVERLAAEDARAPFDLAVAPLMRAKLLRLRENRHVFILNFHHMITDGSSVVVLFEELATLYGSFLEGKPSPLAPLAVQFADYSVWQNEMLQSSEMDLQLQYWRKQLAMCPSLLNLPTDYRRAGVVSYSGAKQSIVLSDELTKRLKEISLEQCATMFMTLLAGFFLLLSRHSGQRDLIVGATVAGRNHPEIEKLIGFFINVLPVRAQLPADITFLRLVQQIRETCLDAYTHQDLPFEKTIEEIKPEREAARQPLVQVLFNLADIAERYLRLPGCEIVKLAPSTLAAKYEIVLSAPEIDGKLQLNMAYNTELFSESRISAMLREFEFLLSQIAANPNEVVDQLSLAAPSLGALLPDPMMALGGSWHGPVYDQIVNHAMLSPQQLAVADVNDPWTYEEIDNYGRQFAADLLTSEIQPGDLVMVYADRSASLVPILLGILRAGAVFAILDPAYPPARLVDLLRIAPPKGWIEMSATGELPQEIADCLAALDLRCRLLVPGRQDKRAKPNEEVFLRQTAMSVCADDPAYIAFTSGTTGQPKGVLCRHGPMTHFLPWQEKRFALGPADRFSVLSGLAYNYLQREIFTALWVGATVYMPSPDILLSPNALMDWLQQKEITVLHLTPALGQFLGMATAAPLLSVRRIFCGGDVLTKHTLAILHKFAPNARITNLYGATETQRASGYFEIPEDMLSGDNNGKEIVPLGRGVEDVQLLLLTPSRKLAGIGEVGELHIRSPHLAAGYIDDGQLTQERFLVNPFGTTATDRMFRTGELGRYLPNGDVERVGRNDRRVNIRGFRVELEEIEAVLRQHPAVTDVAVTMRDFGSSYPERQSIETSNVDAHLIAFIVSNEEDSQSLRDLLHSYLSARLPGYMVPSRFVVLQRLPLNPNGKVDHRALSAITLVQMESFAASIAPQSPVEKQLCSIIAQVLGQPTVGMDENFFRLGGHSLLAVQVVVRIQESFGITLDLRMFLDAPRIASLAQEIEARLRVKDAALNVENAEREEIEL